MKYKPPSERCSNLCGRMRRPGQRLCKECHAANERRRRREHKEEMAKLTRALQAAGIRVD